MNFKEFLSSVSTSDFFAQSPVTCFTSQTYPALFFSTLFDWLKNKNLSTIQPLNLQDKDFGAYSATLSTTFLGSSATYWLGNVADLDDANRKKIITFLDQYEGPHSVIYFIPQENMSKDGRVIVVPDVVDKQSFVLLFTALQGKAAAQRAAPCITALFAHVPTVSLDTACMLIRYITLIGGNPAEFIEQWLDTLVVPDQSLFTLSQYFFAKSSKEFFTYWSRIGKEYSEIFWVSFWSEQIWRATYVVDLMHKNKVADAKAIAFRLPFSLLQRDWKKLSAHELRGAHDFLYSIDCALKNGGSAHSLELLYSKFFLGQFNQQD